MPLRSSSYRIDKHIELLTPNFLYDSHQALYTAVLTQESLVAL